MNSDKEELPIVTFGKYKGGPVTELLADTNYVNWLKLQSWFSNHKVIYNIVVNQTLTNTTDNSKTPEHNRLQNYFLDNSNRKKILKHLMKNRQIHFDKINNLLKDPDIIRCFGENKITDFYPSSTVQFEEKYNWDVVMNLKRSEWHKFESNLEIELSNKIRYKEQYDIEKTEIYNNEILLINELIDNFDKFRLESENWINLLQNNINAHDESLIRRHERAHTHGGVFETDRDYSDDENEDNEDYHIVEKRFNVISCGLLKLWFIKILREKCFYGFEELFFPTIPREIVDKSILLINLVAQIEKLKDKCCEINFRLFSFFRDRALDVWLNREIVMKVKQIYENDYNDNYENNFNKHYAEYRLKYFKDIISKYDIDSNTIDIYKLENQYIIGVNVGAKGDGGSEKVLFFEIKPLLGDDYPNVLRKLRNQIELTSKNNENNRWGFTNRHYYLIIESFTAQSTSKEQLIDIFKQANIKILFFEQIFGTLNSVAIEKVHENTKDKQIIFENNMIKENKLLKDNLTQIQQKLLQAEKKLKQLEEEIKVKEKTI